MDSPHQPSLSRRLLERLRPLATARSRHSPGTQALGRQLFRYCCYETERITQMRTRDPLLAIVLSGTKELWLGGNVQRFAAGKVFVLPAGPDFDVVNCPDPRSGIYEALVVTVPMGQPEVQGGVAWLPPAGAPAGGFDMGIRLTEELVDALAHAAITLQDSAHADVLARYRLAEVLLLLRHEPAARPLFTVTLADRITWLVLGAPNHPWTAEEIGRALGLGSSTLRRHLAEQGTSLRELLATTRMGIAHRVLSSGDGNVTAAAAAAGYASRSHFVKQFQRIYGALPSELRSR